MKERTLVNLFESKCMESIDFSFIHKEIAPNPKFQHMDVEFIYKNTYIRGEVKSTDDVRQKSQSALGVFGAILKGRGLLFAAPEEAEDREIQYALVINKKQREQYRDRFMKIPLKDLLLFGKSFELTYVFLVSDTGIDVESWMLFLKKHTL